MTLSEKRYDYVLRSNREDGEEHGFLVDWSSKEVNPFQLAVKSETPPESYGAPENDELYTGRDLSDAWRIYFTNFMAGSGQVNRDTTDASDAKFYRSNAIDISYPGELRLTHDTSYIELDHDNTLTSLVIEAEGYLVFACQPAAAPGLVGWFDDDGVAHYVTLDESSHSAGTPSALASDGEFIYVACTEEINYGIWRGKCDATTWDHWAALSGISAMVYCGGYMYAVQDNVPGYITQTKTFQALDIDALHKPDLTTFGFQSVGNWVYWGVTAGGARGGHTRVYAIQHNPVEGDRFEHYVELPTGFTGTTMHSYLGNLYIAGYYTTNRGDVGQGAVYVATEQGIARLVNIGDDPNDKTSLELLPYFDDYDNRVRVMYGYGAWLYIATDRALYRWDLDQGGLAHVVDIGSMVESGLKGSPGEETVWDPDYTVTDFTGFWDGVWGDGTFEFGEQRPGDMHHGLDGDDLWVYSDTNNNAGNHCAALWRADPASMTAGSLQVSTTTLRQDACSFGIQIGTKLALVRIFARESDDKFCCSIRVEDAWQTTEYLDKRLADHTFQLSFDGYYANLWVDNVRLLSDVIPVTVATSSEHLFVTAGWWDDYSGGHAKDWRVQFTQLKASTTVAGAPDYAPGAALIPNMTIINGVPFIPWLAPGPPSLDADRFITQDVEQFVESGWLTTSWRSARMPTVAKHFTAIEVFYARLATGESLRIDYEIDDGTLGSFSLPGEDEYVSGSVSFLKRIDTHGRRIRLTFTLVSTTQTTTPRCFGACVRFNPAASKTYQMLTLFKDNLRDYDNIDYDYLDAYEFIMNAADTGEVLDLRARGIDVRAKVTAVQFLKAKASRQHSYEPQGTALVQMQKIE